MKIHKKIFHNNDEKNSCDICGYQVLQKKSLTRHKKIVYDEVNGTCTYSQENRVQQQRAGHEGIKYYCRQCNQEFTTKGSLAQHQSAVHVGVTHPCGQCNKEFTARSSLARHQREVHEGVKYPCNLCSYQATQKGNLKRHNLAKHHLIPEL